MKIEQFCVHKSFMEGGRKGSSFTCKKKFHHFLCNRTFSLSVRVKLEMTLEGLIYGHEPNVCCFCSWVHFLIKNDLLCEVGGNWVDYGNHLRKFCVGAFESFSCKFFLKAFIEFFKRLLVNVKFLFKISERFYLILKKTLRIFFESFWKLLF